MQFNILNRLTNAVQFTAEIECADDALSSIKLGLAVLVAIKARANLTGVNLTGAYLAGADLSDAYLSGAYLSGAYLADANLADADLSGANVANANLAYAYLAGADLSGANLTGANLRGALQIDEAAIPIVENIDGKILAAIEGGGSLNMRSWHTCETTHCRAGWAIHLAGKAGAALENLVGPQMAGALIYRKSRPGKPAPWFFAPDEVALADIKKCAAEQSTANAPDTGAA